MKKATIAFAAVIALVAGCGSATTPLSRIKSQPVADYCFEARNAQSLVDRPGVSLMGGSSVYRAEMAKRLAALQDLCGRQTRGEIPAPGQFWDK